MNNEEYLLDWFKNHVWSRIRPSNVCDGVGIFAIRDIPKGTSVYDMAPKTVDEWIPYETVVETLPMGVVDMIIDAQPIVGSKLCDSDFVWKEEYEGNMSLDELELWDGFDYHISIKNVRSIIKKIFYPLFKFIYRPISY